MVSKVVVELCMRLKDALGPLLITDLLILMRILDNTDIILVVIRDQNIVLRIMLLACANAVGPSVYLVVDIAVVNNLLILRYNAFLRLVIIISLATCNGRLAVSKSVGIVEDFQLFVIFY